jgi:predicted HTH domain antitoxin
MTISFDLPTDVEQQLRMTLGNLGQAAKEALLIKAYTQGRISVGRIAESLDMGVLQVQQWLFDNGIPLNYTVGDLKADQETLAKLFPEG